MSAVVEAFAGAALSALFGTLLEKLKSVELFKIATEAQVVKKIEKWEEMLSTFQNVLEDSEERMITEKGVKSWLLDLKHLAYDVEDILDEFSTECLLRKLKGERQAAASSSRIPKFVPACSCFTSSTPWAFSFDHEDMMSRIRGINDRFEVIMIAKEKFKLVESVRRTSRMEPQQRTSSCVPDETVVYGRDTEKREILELLRYKTGDAKVGVIPIVGMGGLGKTTLVKLVYDDDSMRDHHFQVKGWICVSDVFDIMRVTKGILESITGQSSDLKDLSNVQIELKKKLAGRKFLLVLDDVWTENYDDWHNMCPPLMVGAPGSKIIVTTRSAKVAKMMGTVVSYNLKQISIEDCWLLFKKHAFENNAIVSDLQLENIGREIVNKRCGGLPLAARTLGGLLRTKESRHEWEEVLNNNLWDVSKEISDILPVLEVSYHYLPSHLKRCFAYCAILPKDVEFEREKIILLWMAEGLIQQGDGKKEMDDLGNEYYQDLLSRSIFQASSADKSLFIMHDLVNDLAKKVAEDVCFRLEDKVDAGEVFKWERVRYSSYIQSCLEATKRFAPFCNMKCLRTFLPLLGERHHTCRLASSIPCELVQNLKFVRVLSFCRYAIKKLPDSIGDLKHLRYLDLSHSDIEVLPKTTTSLCNLQTLILEGCGGLSRLPERMDNLIHLRHLNIVGVNLDEGIPLEIKQLSGLRSLPEVAIGKGSGSFTIANLMNLKSLRGELSIKDLDNVVDGSDALTARMNEKEGIRVLKLTWQTRFDVHEVQCGVLNALRPHESLSELVVNGYEGAYFPPWITNSTHSNIVHLRLEGCWKCMSLPQLGMLPKLKTLFIKEMSSLQKVDRDFYGNNCPNPFPCLEVLLFEEMRDWEEWNVFEFEFRALRELCIRRCGKLSGKLPIHLPSLEKLVIGGCQNLVASLPPLPRLSMLEIVTCKEVVFSCKDDLGSLTTLLLVNISSITSPVGGFLQRLKKFKELHVLAYSQIEFPGYYHNMLSYSMPNLKCLFAGCPQLMSMVINEDKEQIQMEVERLVLNQCGMLEKVPAWIQKLMLLKNLTIEEWPSLVTFPEGTMYQSRCFEILNIHGCESLISFGKRQLPPTLKKLNIRHCINLKSLFHEEDEGDTSSSSSINLEHLEIRGCESLTSISPTRDLPATLKYLSISNCPNLTYVLARGKLPSGLQSFQQDEGDTSSSTSINLERLVIRGCESLTSISSTRDLPATLKYLSISNCPNLTYVLAKGKLPSGLQSFQEDEGDTSSSTSINLEHLDIWRCESLTSISSTRELPVTLKYLSICNCPNLTYVLARGKLASGLQSLSIVNCEKIESIAEGFDNNSSLETLSINTCSSLKALPEGLGNLINLSEFKLYDCPCIVSFPRGGLPTTCLTDLTIEELEKLEALPDNLHRLSSLQKLTIRDCPKLVSLPSEGLPSNLTSLDIANVKVTKALFEWGLDRLSSLQNLQVKGGYEEMTTFPSEKTKIRLPPSLISLNISDFPNLKNLSNRCFRDLTSLESLTILGCRQLASFPKNGLPDSLLRLQVVQCPLLKQRCEEGKVPSKILNTIPCVEFY